MAQGGVSVEAQEIFAQSKEALDITLLGSEWNSSAGGLSTLNRELAIHLSQEPNVRVSVLVPEGACNHEDKEAAQNFGINVLDAGQQPGFSEPLDWLGFPPQDHTIDVVVGHGVKLGRQVNVIKRSPQFQNCRWVHMVHTAPEDLSKYKGYNNPTSRGEQKHWNEVDLCKCADLVVPVGSRLKKAYSSYLQGCKKDEDIFEIVPGLFNREFGDLVQQAKVESDDFKVLLCGRGDDEDFELKGYDIAVKAFADQCLKGKRCYLLFVGAPDGKQDEVRRRLLNCGITDEQLTVRKFVQSRARMRDLFCEVDLVIMPSKSEGFGLVALEALSAGLPVLVGSNSGFARAMEGILFGAYSIVYSEDPVKWAEAIEGVRIRHRACIEENKLLKENYERHYCWKRQCKALIDKLWRMIHGTDSSGIAKVHLQRPGEEQLPAITSGSLHDHPSVHKQKINEFGESSTSEASAAATCNLVEEQPSAIRGAFVQAAPTTMQQHAFQEDGVTSYRENARTSGQRKTSSAKKGMDANEIRQRSNPAVTSREERSLRAFGGEADVDFLSSQQGLLNQESSTSEMNTSADYMAVKEQETSCAMRMKKAKVSRSALHRASVNGQYEEVNRHLKSGANVDERDQFLLTPLHLACWYGHECVVKLLLDHNADVNAVDRFQFTPLQKAERHNHQSIIQLLLDHGAKPSLQQPLSLRTFAKRAFLRTDSHSGFNLLQAAVLQGDCDSVYKASNCLENFVDEMKCETISNNASIFHGKSAVDVLSSMNWRKTGHVAIEILYQRLVKIDERLKELHLCVKRGDVEKVIELVLNDGMDVNVAAMSNITPLLLASRMSCSVLIKTLIDLGADVNAQTAPAKEGPLVFAASGNNYMVARVLLEHGADANIRDRWGETPLHKAVTEKDVPLVKLLLEMKADANIQDQSGETPLHKAVRPKGLLRFVEFLGNMADPNIQDRLKQTYLRDRNLLYEADVPLVKLLLKNKANANIQNQSGTTPLHLCAFYGRSHISLLLIESGCNINRRNNKGETPRDIETPERQWSKTPSAGYSQQVESLTLVERSRPAWQEVTDLKPESRGKVKAEDLLLPQTARPPHGSEQNLKERVRKAREKRRIKRVVKKKRQQLSSGEEESQAQVTRQPEVTKEAKAEGQASG